MPRKKAAAAAGQPHDELLRQFPPAAPAAIACPACKSKISADGKTLHEKSGYLEELLETDAGIDEAEKLIEKKLGDRDATIADLRGRLASAETQLEKLKAATPAPAPQKETANVGQEQKRKSWWD